MKRVYGADRIATHNYGTVLASVAFAGTIVGMLTFGYLSDKMGRKFGMVRSLADSSDVPSPTEFLQMLATGIVALFSGLSAASSGAHGSLNGLLAMLTACRFLLGIGVGAEYPCGSVAASEQSEEEGVQKGTQNRWFALATSKHFKCFPRCWIPLTHSALIDSMIDFGFVISSFVPLVLFWM